MHSQKIRDIRVNATAELERTDLTRARRRNLEQFVTAAAKVEADLIIEESRPAPKAKAPASVGQPLVINGVAQLQAPEPEPAHDADEF